MLLLRIAPVLVLLLPLVEIVLFVEIGGSIGAGWTILHILVTAVLGLAVLRRAGMDNLRRAGMLLHPQEILMFEMLERFVLAIAGVLLFLPGFLTDAVGLCLLPSPLRRLVVRRFLARVRAADNRQAAPVIEAEYHVKNEIRE